MLVVTVLAAVSPPDDRASTERLYSAGTGIDEFLQIVRGLRIHVLSDETSFREAFLRFPNDELNGISPAKLERLGQEAVILNAYSDYTVTCRFDDGAQYDMPADALARFSEADSEGHEADSKRDQSRTGTLPQCIARLSLDVSCEP